MSKKRILIVEDEKNISRLIQYNLDHAGYACEVAGSGEDGLKALERQPADLVLLDVMLPGADGFEICRRIKQDDRLRHIPVIMLTARGQEVDRVVGLELGAEDYIVKPFSPRELVLRVKTALKRHQEPAAGEEVLKAGELCVDRARHRVTVKGKEVALTAMELKLLGLLMERGGRVQDRDKLLTDVWGIEAEVFTRTVDTHIRRLRVKLGSAGKMIETVIGAGYRFKEGHDED